MAGFSDQPKVVKDEDALGQDQLDSVSGGLNIGSQSGGAGAGMTLDDESPKEELGG